jgi:protein pelota
MQLLHTNLKRGIIRLKIESMDDLWHFKHVLMPGDLVTAKTKRKISIKRAGEIEHGEKKTMVLTIKIERFGFKEDTHNLRLTGPIQSGPKDMVRLGSYHTINIEPGLVLTIQKNWKPYQLERLKKACIKHPLLMICMIDREQADFAELRESGIKLLGSMYSRKFKDKEDFYKEIINHLERQRDQHIIVAGPGFERENLFKFIKNKKPELAKMIIIEHSSCIGKTGINEVIKRSANRVLRETRIAKETELIEKLFKGISSNGLVVYGEKQVNNAVSMGAIETLMVSDLRIEMFEELMDNVEKQKGKVFIISTEHESGERFLHLGGIAGFLRFRV